VNVAGVLDAAVWGVISSTAIPVAHFQYREVQGIGHEAGTCRRDPSDVIQVDGVSYVWYSKVTHEEALYPSGYRATVWYATSEDHGLTWEEQGEAVGVSSEGFDSHATFTPNILVVQGRYYLAYTAVCKGFTNKGYSDVNRTAIGMAVAESPRGPWRKLPANPILQSSRDPERFDSFRVDDSCFLLREGKVWLYYKGRQWEKTPRETKMGVAVADRPEGLYVKQNQGRAVCDSGHEILVWPVGQGVMSLVSDTGPHGRTLQYALDGLHFRVVGDIPKDFPKAPGAFRPDLTELPTPTSGIEWGISMVHGKDPYLVRYAITMDLGDWERIVNP